MEDQDEEGSDNAYSTPQLVATRGSNNNSEPLESASDSESIDPPLERRATRTRKQPLWMIDYETNLFVEEESLLAMLMTDFEDPQTFEEASTS